MRWGGGGSTYVNHGTENNEKITLFDIDGVVGRE